MTTANKTSTAATKSSKNDIAALIERARKRFFNSLPQKSTCPHCEKTRSKEKFGIRLMNGPDVYSGKAEKPVFRVQSHCTECRS